MRMNVADLLIEKINEKQNPCVVGLDPRISLIPVHIRKTCLQQYGDTIEGTCQAILYFNCEIIDAVSDIVAVVKPQMAFYEQYGFEGVRAFQETVRYAKMTREEYSLTISVVLLSSKKLRKSSSEGSQRL